MSKFKVGGYVKARHGINGVYENSYCIKPGRLYQVQDVEEYEFKSITLVKDSSGFHTQAQWFVDWFIPYEPTELELALLLP